MGPAGRSMFCPCPRNYFRSNLAVCVSASLRLFFATYLNLLQKIQDMNDLHDKEIVDAHVRK